MDSDIIVKVENSCSDYDDDTEFTDGGQDVVMGTTTKTQGIEGASDNGEIPPSYTSGSERSIAKEPNVVQNQYSIKMEVTPEAEILAVDIKTLEEKSDAEISDDDSDSANESSDQSDCVEKPKNKNKASINPGGIIRNPKVLKIHPGHYPCEFCSVVKEFAPELAVHEAMEHSQPKTIPGKTDWQCSRCKHHYCMRKRYIKHFYQIHLCKNPSSLKRIPGNYPCQFCDGIKKNGKELALHEALEHNTVPETVTEKAKYNCSRCPYNATSQKRYISHFIHTHLLNRESSQDSNKQLVTEEPCEICQLNLPVGDQISKQRHFQYYHNLSKVDKSKVERCDECPAYFVRGIQLITHKQKIHGAVRMSKSNRKIYSCKDCKKHFSFMKLLWNHRREECEERTTFTFNFTCDIAKCGEKFESSADLDYHITRTHASDKCLGAVQMCSTCGKKCVGDFGLQSHMETHQPRKDIELSCKICERKCVGVKGLKRHMKYHRTPKELGMDCKICGKRFKSTIYLNNHLLLHRDPSEMGFKCMECGKLCTSNFRLKAHMKCHQRTETGEKPYACTLCDARFTREDGLKYHMSKNKHVIRDRPFACGMCSARFTRDDLRKRHMKTNCKLRRPEKTEQDVNESKTEKVGASKTFANSFVCEQCGKAFKYESHFLSHITCHQDSLSPECKECSKTFPTKQKLKEHMRCHNSRNVEKQHGCKFCPKTFVYPISLSRHVKQKHKEVQGQKGDLAQTSNDLVTGKKIKLEVDPLI